MMPFLCIINAPYTPMIPSADAHFLTFLALPPLWEVPEEPDHTEFMVLALQLDDVKGDPSWVFPVENALPGERLALVLPLLVSP